MSHIPHVTCQVSGVWFKGVRCHMSFFVVVLKQNNYKVVDLVCEGSLTNGATPFSFFSFSYIFSTLKDLLSPMVVQDAKSHRPSFVTSYSIVLHRVKYWLSLDHVQQTEQPGLQWR